MISGSWNKASPRPRASSQWLARSSTRGILLLFGRPWKFLRSRGVRGSYLFVHLNRNDVVNLRRGEGSSYRCRYCGRRDLFVCMGRFQHADGRWGGVGGLWNRRSPWRLELASLCPPLSTHKYLSNVKVPYWCL